MAKNIYGDQFLWWIIAQRNEITLPATQVFEGKRIVIPDPNYVLNEIVGLKQKVGR